MAGAGPAMAAIGAPEWTLCLLSQGVHHGSMHNDDAPPDAAGPGLPHSLVLFAGFGLRPERELLDGLAQVGVRGLWLGAAAQALGAASFARFDAVVLKVRGPMADAARSFEGWRRTLGCPLLVVAEAGDEFDEIIALELGADGYLAGPVPPRRLRAHLLMLLRRAQPSADSAAPAAPLRAGAWTLDRSANRLQRGRHEVDLTELQAALLQVLIAEQGRVVLRARLAEAVSRGRELHVRSVDVYIARLRCRLRDERVAGLEIDGVRGRGYRLTVLGDDPAASALPAGASLRWVAPAGPFGAVV